jgi:hypothetical protein
MDNILRNRVKSSSGSTRKNSGILILDQIIRQKICEIENIIHIRPKREKKVLKNEVPIKNPKMLTFKLLYLFKKLAYSNKLSDLNGITNMKVLFKN